MPGGLEGASDDGSTARISRSMPSATPAYRRQESRTGEVRGVWPRRVESISFGRVETPGSRPEESTVDWYRQIQFVAAVAMPADIARAYGTTVNGMWADPEQRSPQYVADDHEHGNRVLFSVPMIALVPRVYEAEETAYLLDEVCRDVHDDPAECDWYYWQPKPVYAACIYSARFRGYLFGRCIEGVDKGMDVVNLDEINTSIGLMDRDPGGTGFCHRCLDRFRSHLREAGEPLTATVDDAELRDRLGTDDTLYQAYRRFHELEAFQVMTEFIRDLRSYAADRSEFAVSANVAYLGSSVAVLGPLWGALWGRYLDFILMENHYRVEPGAPHLLLPRGTYGPWYRLGFALTGAPTWICPSITVPKQLAGEPRTTYYQLMFLEAYANAGRWGYHWWPGVDAQTRLEATAPESLKAYIRFIGTHRGLYEGAEPDSELAILYADRSILARPSAHDRYVALAQALAETGHQFDVVFCGDGHFNPERVDTIALARYHTVVLPEARELGADLVAALESYARSGGKLVTFSESPLDPGLVREASGDLLVDFWRHYRDDDRNRIIDEVAAPATAQILASDPEARVTRFRLGDRQVLHLLAYSYDEADDRVRPINNLGLRIPWPTNEVPVCTLVDPDGERVLPGRLDDGAVAVEIPLLNPYALLVVAPPVGPASRTGR